MDVNLQQVLIKCENACKSETNLRAVNIFQWCFLQGLCLMPSNNVFLCSFCMKCLSMVCHRENDDGWASDSGVKMQICLRKPVFTTGAQMQLICPKFTWEIFTFRRTNIFLNCMFLPEGRHPLTISAESVIEMFFNCLFPNDWVCCIQKIRGGDGFFCWLDCPKQ